METPCSSRRTAASLNSLVNILLGKPRLNTGCLKNGGKSSKIVNVILEVPYPIQGSGFSFQILHVPRGMRKRRT